MMLILIYGLGKTNENDRLLDDLREIYWLKRREILFDRIIYNQRLHFLPLVDALCCPSWNIDSRGVGVKVQVPWEAEILNLHGREVAFAGHSTTVKKVTDVNIYGLWGDRKKIAPNCHRKQLSAMLEGWQPRKSALDN
jgi:hypothetical protein